jgi:hypothetical protein
MVSFPVPSVGRLGGSVIQRLRGILFGPGGAAHG